MAGYLDVARRFVARLDDAATGPPRDAANERNEENEERAVGGPVRPPPPSRSLPAEPVAVGADERPTDRRHPGIGRDGRGPEPASPDPAVAATIANVRALPEHERAAWQREVVAMLRWAEAGGAPDPYLGHDLAALRRLAPVGVCLDCGGPCPADGSHWCARCRTKERTTR